MTYQDRVAHSIQVQIISLAESLASDYPKITPNTLSVIALLGLNLTPKQVVEHVPFTISEDYVRRIKSRYKPFVALLQEETDNMYSAANLL